MSYKLSFSVAICAITSATVCQGATLLYSCLLLGCLFALAAVATLVATFAAFCRAPSLKSRIRTTHSASPFLQQIVHTIITTSSTTATTTNTHTATATTTSKYHHQLQYPITTFHTRCTNFGLMQAVQRDTGTSCESTSCEWIKTKLLA